MRIKRRASIVAVDPVEDNRNICNSCYEENCITKLVPYDKDPSMKICPACHTIVSKDRMRFFSQTEPLGSLAGKKPTFEVAEKRRTRSRRNVDSLSPTEDEIPKLNGQPDKDLEILLSGNAILVSCTDTNADMDSEGEEY